MKKLISIAVLSFLVVSGAALAQQSGDQEKGSSMQGMMGQMMQGEKSGQGGMGDMKGMMKMMGQMSKMMDQCASMMESAQAKDGKTEPGQPK
jgi:hypothetical protein